MGNVYPQRFGIGYIQDLVTWYNRTETLSCGTGILQYDGTGRGGEPVLFMKSGGLSTQWPPLFLFV